MYSQIRESIEQLVNISDDDFNLFISYLTPIKVKKRTKLLEQGGKPNSSYFVNIGLLYFYHLSADGEQHVVQITKENSWVGDISGYNNNPSSNFNIEALENSELLELNFLDFKEVCKKAPTFERYFRLLFQKAYYHILNRVVLTDVQSAEEKYFKIMKDDPGLILRTPQKVIASFIGIKPQSLSRIKKSAYS